MKNLRDVQDVAPAGGFGDIQEARFARKDLDAEQTGLAYHVLRPGKRQGFAHKHDRAEEIFVVLSGSGRMKVDDDVLEVGPMDSIRVAPHAVRAFEAGSDEPLEILVFGPHYENDGELVHEDVWSD